ncbi:hypothetical protein ACFPRL_26865 [Pseudoclavibacter helvolus]
MLGRMKLPAVHSCERTCNLAHVCRIVGECQAEQESWHCVAVSTSAARQQHPLNEESR